MKKEEEFFSKMAKLMLISDAISTEIYRFEDSIKELEEKRDLVLKEHHIQEHLARKHLKLGSYETRMRFLMWSNEKLLGYKESLTKMIDEVLKEINQ